MKTRAHLMAFAALSAVWLAGCERAAISTPEAGPDTAAEADHRVNNEVELGAEQVEKLGIVTNAATAVTFVPEATGYGIVVGHDAVAQSLADVETAKAAVRQSQAALARVNGLRDTPGAFSAETQENAERQASADQTGLVLARRKLSATWGAQSPWSEDEASAVLRTVASGKVKLVRATFPLGAISAAHPRTLLFAHLAGANATSRWGTNEVWDASADTAIPGRSFFALLKDGDAAEGERLEAWAPVGAGIAGVLIPQSAAVISDGQSWCYVETQHGHFERRAIDASRPTEGGYFVESGVAVGESVVSAGAGLLLARETNPSTEAE